MSLLTDAAYVVAAVAGAGLVGVAGHVSRQQTVLGRRALAGFFGLLGVGSVLIGVTAAAGVVPSLPKLPEFPGEIVGTGAIVATTTVPISVFALQYTGRTTRPSRRLLAVLAGVLVAFVVWLALVWIQPEGDLGSGLILVASVLWSLPSLALAAVAMYVLAGAVDGRVLDTTEAVGLLVPMLAVNTVWRVMSVVFSLVGQPAVAICVAVVPVVSLLTAAPVFLRRDPFATFPAARRIGREAAIRDTDDLVVVADDDDTIVETNAAADAIVDGTVGRSTVADLFGATSDELARAETVQLSDERSYDPQVSRLSDHRDRPLGAVISLRDVTAREAREQRLSVLNRVLRHNVRNQMDVVRAHAEAIDDDHAAAIVEQVDAVAKLGQDARTVDRLVSGSEAEPVRIDEVVDRVVREHCETVDEADRTDASAPSGGDEPPRIEVERRAVVADGVGRVTLTATAPAATVVTDERALRVALASAVSNAVEYASSRVTVDCRPREAADGYVVSVADDGPGLPESERAALDVDRETQLEHATGLGLWKLRWAVDALGGSVSVATDDGTTVSVTVPNLG